MICVGATAAAAVAIDRYIEMSGVAPRRQPGCATRRPGTLEISTIP